MRVLEHACGLCRRGGLVLDLTTVPPAAAIEVGGTVLGRLDQTTFLRGAALTEVAVDAAVAAGALVEEQSVRHDVLKHYDSGAAAIADVDARPRTHLPDALCEALVGVSGPVVERAGCLLRRLRIE